MADMTLKQFAKAMRKSASGMNKELRTELKSAADTIADDARALADSGKIAATIRTRVFGATGQTGKIHLRIEAGGDGVPEAALRERGNLGSNPEKTTFKHPVYGHWYKATPPQAKHPFLMPATIANRDRTLTRVHEAMRKTFPGG